jgi:hypothetical protein
MRNVTLVHTKFFELRSEPSKDEKVVRIMRDCFSGKVERFYRKGDYFYIEVAVDKKDSEFMRRVGETLKYNNIVTSYDIL